MWWAADQIVSSYRVFPLFVSLAQAMREVNKIKQNKTPERLSAALHCGVGSLMSLPQSRRKRHHHVATDLKYGEECTVMFLGTSLSALLTLLGWENWPELKLLLFSYCSLSVCVPNSWLVVVRAVSAL